MERIINVGGRMHSILTGNKTVITADVFDETIDEKQNIINLKTPGFVVEPPSESYFDNSAGYVGYASQNPTEAQMQIARNNISAASRQELTDAINRIINSGTAGGGSEIVLPISHSWGTTGEDSYSIERGIVAARFAAIEPLVNDLKSNGVIAYLSYDPERDRIVKTVKSVDSGGSVVSSPQEVLSFSNFARKDNVVSDITYSGNEFTISKPGQQDVKISASKIVSDGGGGGSIDTSNIATKTELNNHVGNPSVHVTAQEKEIWNNKQSAISDYETTKAKADAAFDFIQGGIQISELSNEVQLSLSKANSSLLPSALIDYATTNMLNQSLNGKQAVLNGTNGDSGQNIKSINGNSILGTGNLKLVPYNDNGDVTIAGTLTLSSLQPQNGVLAAEGGEVFSDARPYMVYMGSKENYSDLLNGDTSVKVGDTYFVEELNSLITAIKSNIDTNLYVNTPSKNNQRVKYTLLLETDHPAVQERTFMNYLKGSGQNDFSAYPSVTSIEFHKQNAADLFSYTFWDQDSEDAFFRIVPVKKESNNDLMIALVAENTSKTYNGVKKAYVASNQDGGELNTWYVSNYGLSNTGEVIEIDIQNSLLLPEDGLGINKEKRYFYTFGGGIEWAKPANTSIKTVNGMSLKGSGNVLITPNNSVYSATGNISSPIITDSTSYDDIDVIINYGFIPVFKDENGYYFHLWKHDTESLESTYEFANWIEDNNSITFKVYSIADAADSTWNSRTISLT